MRIPCIRHTEVNLFILSIAVYGLTLAYIESPIFKYPRKMTGMIHKNLAECYMCIGFWVSIAIQILVYDHVKDPVRIFVIGVFCATIAVFLDRIHSILYNIIVGREHEEKEN